MWLQNLFKYFLFKTPTLYPQACQTQNIARAANWALEVEKFTAGRSLELHDTLSQFYTYFSQFNLKMDNILVIFHE